MEVRLSSQGLTEDRGSSQRSDKGHRGKTEVMEVRGSSQGSEGGLRDLKESEGAHKGQTVLTEVRWSSQGGSQRTEGAHIGQREFRENS